MDIDAATTSLAATANCPLQTANFSGGLEVQPVALELGVVER
jgi:hypothetical protein